MLLIALATGGVLLRGSDGAGTATVSKDGAKLSVTGATIVLPPSALPDGAIVSVRGVEAPPDASYPADILVAPIYDVAVRRGSPLRVPATVTLAYDASKAGSAQPYGVVWDGMTWERMRSTVDAAARTVTFEAEHFTNISVAVDSIDADPFTGQTVWDRASTGHFDISFASSSTRPGRVLPLSGADYVSPDRTPSPSAPSYIRDLATYLEDAYVRMAAMGYQMPPATERIAVKVRPLGNGIFGATGAFGAVEVSNELRDKDGKLLPAAEVWKRLKPTAGHELFHYVQRYNAGFPTWFYEASAVFMEWRLYGKELPDVLNDRVAPYAHFLYDGLWTASPRVEQYAKASFLVYLQQKYGTKCDGASSDVLKDGFMAGRGAGSMAAAGLRSAVMQDAFVEAARRCGGSSVKWEDLFEAFARSLYFDWTAWPMGGRLVGNDHSAAIVSMEDKQKVTGFLWDMTTDRGGFRKLAFADGRATPDASAPLWAVRATNGEKEPTATLVVRRPTGTSAEPRYWVYAYGHDAKQGAALGPSDFSGKTSSVAVPHFGPRTTGGLVSQVLIAAVRPGQSGFWGSDVELSPTVYLLPSPLSLRSEAASAGKLQISWVTSSTWFPKELAPELHYEVWAAPTLDLKGGKLAASVPAESTSATIDTPASGLSVHVVLVDSSGNKGTVATLTPVSTTATPRDILVAARAALGWSGTMRVGGSCLPDRCDTSEPSGLDSTQTLQVSRESAAYLDTLARVRTERGSTGTMTTYRGYKAFRWVLPVDPNAPIDPITGRSRYESRAIIAVAAEPFVYYAEARCTGSACASAPPTREIDALLDAAAKLGVLPPTR